MDDSFLVRPAPRGLVRPADGASCFRLASTTQAAITLPCERRVMAANRDAAGIDVLEFQFVRSQDFGDESASGHR